MYVIHTNIVDAYEGHNSCDVWINIQHKRIFDFSKPACYKQNAFKFIEFLSQQYYFYTKLSEKFDIFTYFLTLKKLGSFLNSLFIIKI